MRPETPSIPAPYALAEPASSREASPPGPTSEAKRPADRWWLAAILAAAAALRLAGIGAQSLWIDELLSIYRSQHILDAGPGAELWNGHGPAYFYLLAGILPAGSAEWWVRLPSAILGVGLVWASWLLGRAFFGRRGGFAAAGLMAISPYAVWYAQEARYGSLFMLFAALSLLSGYRLVTREGRGDLAAYVATSLLMLLSFVGGVFVVAAQNLWLPFASPSRSRLRRWFLAQGLVALVFVPWFVHAYEVDVDPFSDEAEEGSDEFSVSGMQAGYSRPTQLVQVGYVTFAFATGYSLGPSQEELHRDLSLRVVRRTAWAVVPAVLLVGAVGLAGLVFSWRRFRRDTALLLLVVLVPVLGAYALSSVSGIAYNVRYTAGAFPAFVLLLAAGVLWCLERLRSRGWLVAGFGAVLLVALANYYANPVYSKEDSRGAARILARERAPGEPLIVGAFTRPLDYYYAGSLLRWRDVRLEPGASPAAAPEALAGDRVWVVVTRVWAKPKFAGFLKQMQACYSLDKSFHLTGYEVRAYRMVPAPGAAACALTRAPAAGA